MKALITGATGFIGSHVADLLLARGYDVRAIARKTSNLRWLSGKNIEIIDGGLSNPASLQKAMEDVEIVFHVAGLTAARNAEEFMRGNRDGTRNMLEAAYKYAPNIKRFLHVSSLAAVRPATSLDAPVDETTPSAPITSYGISKKAAEDEVNNFAGKLPITIVRPPAVYGPRESAILDFFKTVKSGFVPHIGFDEKHVSLVNGLDLSRGIIEAAESPNTIGETYFISSDEFYTWEQIGNVTAKAFGKSRVFPLRLPHFLVFGVAGMSEFFGRFAKNPPVLNFEKGRDITQRYWICSIEKAKRDFGYSQQISIEDGIRETVEWYKEHKWL